RLTNGGWDCGTTTPTIPPGTGTITCTIGSLASGASSANLTLVVKVGSGASGTINNTATAFSVTSDPTKGNNAKLASTSVGPASSDLTITKTASTPADPSAGSTVVPGQIITYTITATNSGPSDDAGAGSLKI